MYRCRAARECAGAAAVGPVSRSSSLAVTKTDMLALRGVAVSLSPSTPSSASEPAGSTQRIKLPF